MSCCVVQKARAIYLQNPLCWGVSVAEVQFTHITQSLSRLLTVVRRRVVLETTSCSISFWCTGQCSVASVLLCILYTWPNYTDLLFFGLRYFVNVLPGGVISTIFISLLARMLDRLLGFCYVMRQYSDPQRSKR